MAGLSGASRMPAGSSSCTQQCCPSRRHVCHNPWRAIAAGVLAADNEGVLLGRVLLETTVEGAKQLSSHVLESLGRFFADEP